MTTTFEADLFPGMPMPEGVPGPEPTPEPTPEPPPDTAPKRGRGRPRGSKSTTSTTRERAPRTRTATGAAKTRKEIERSLCGLHELAAMGLTWSGMPVTGAALAQAGPVAAPVLAPMVERNPWLLKLVTSGENGAAILQLLLVYQAVYQAATAERAAIAAAREAGVPYAPAMPAEVPTP